MRVFVIGLLSSVMVGCGTTVSRVIEQNGVYGVMGESEFSQVELMEALYSAAEEQCGKTGKRYRIEKVDHGSGGVGAFSQKSTSGIYFTCI